MTKDQPRSHRLYDAIAKIVIAAPAAITLALAALGFFN